MIRKLVVAGLLVIFSIIVTASVSTKSPICDEAAHHIGSGYSFLKTGDFRMNPSAPPLLRMFMALPLIPLDLKLPIDHPSWQSVDSSQFNYQFLFVYNKDADKVVFLSRLPMLFLSILFGLTVFLCAKRIFGYKSAVFSLFLYVFSPAILANAGLAMLDMGCSFLIFLSLFQCWRYLKNRSFLNLVLLGICTGLALSTKISAITLLPFALFLMLIDYSLNRRELSLAAVGGRFLLIACIGFLVLWATYFFEFKPLLQNAPDVQEKINYLQQFAGLLPFGDKEKIASFLVNFAQHTPIPLSTYITSFLGIGKEVVVGGQRLFFLGNEFTGGSKIYYLVDYLIKTPLPEIILLFIALIFVRRRSKVDFLTNAFLIVPPLAFFLLASFSKLQGGIRYLLPAYPFVAVWVSDLANIKPAKFPKAFKASFFGLCAWYFVASLSAFPNYLSYFNEIVGGSHGRGYTVTADADWGQDFKELKKYLDVKGISNIKLYCFGSVDPAYYGINFKTFSEEDFKSPAVNTYYAISARYLSAVRWQKQFKPVARVANTIFIYYINKGSS